jgi:hypothetical protein
MPFRRVKTGNQWGVKTYKVGRKKIEADRPGSCVIRWPDDHEEVVLFYPVSYTTVVHGHGCGVGGQAVEGHVPTFYAEIHGRMVSVPLAEVLVDPATLSQEE